MPRGKPNPPPTPPVDFFVDAPLSKKTGRPVAPPGKGSMDTFPHKQTGRMIVTPNSKYLPGWQRAVSAAAQQAWPYGVTSRAIAVRAVFIFPRPRSHYGTGRNVGTLKDWALKARPLRKPDVDKQLRGILDAMTGKVYRDDSQVTHEWACKVYGPTPGAEIRVWYARDTVSGTDPLRYPTTEDKGD